MCRTLSVDTAPGRFTLIAREDALTHLILPRRPLPALPASGGTPLLRAAAAQLTQYLRGERRAFDLPLAPAGTAFETAVWRALAGIPCGQTRSYAEIAAAIGRPAACRAVGRANGRNPLPIFLPCHRVIGARGALTGYAGGLPLKRALLALERGETPPPGDFPAAFL